MKTTMPHSQHSVCTCLVAANEGGEDEVAVEEEEDEDEVEEVAVVVVVNKGGTTRGVCVWGVHRRPNEMERGV